VTNTPALRFPFPAPPSPGSVQEVAPRVKWLRMPLPFALDHINLSVLENNDGWMLVDTGINTTETSRLWEQVFAGPLKSKPVTRLLCTHFHPDHIGLAGWLADRHGIALEITGKEWAMARTTREAQPDADLTAAFYARIGFPLTDSSTVPGYSYASRVHPLPATHHVIDPSKPITAAGVSWRVVVGEGHSPEHAALYSAESNVLISGDQVLPGISPNVSVRVETPDANPLKDFLESLARFHDLPADTLVLPSHKLPFFGLHERIDQIVAHHRDRLAVAKAACTGVTAMDILSVIFPRALDDHQVHFAIGETLAHLNYLMATGEVERSRTSTGPDLYRAIAAA
jgi:glyoxylase-like metal-dependent hydrolase (beta-lactamase superfamily II)